MFIKIGILRLFKQFSNPNFRSISGKALEIEVRTES